MRTGDPRTDWALKGYMAPRAKENGGRGHRDLGLHRAGRQFTRR